MFANRFSNPVSIVSRILSKSISPLRLPNALSKLVNILVKASDIRSLFRLNASTNLATTFSIVLKILLSNRADLIVLYIVFTVLPKLAKALVNGSICLCSASAAAAALRFTLSALFIACVNFASSGHADSKALLSPAAPRDVFLIDCIN